MWKNEAQAMEWAISQVYKPRHYPIAPIPVIAEGVVIEHERGYRVERMMVP